MPDTLHPHHLSLVHKTTERQSYLTAMEDCLSYVIYGNEDAKERFHAAESRLSAAADLKIINECIEEESN